MRRTRRGMRRTVLAVAAACLLALPAGAAGQETAAQGITGTNGAPVPELDWGACPAGSPAGYECAVAEVPLSYRDPAGQSLELGIGRLPATDQANKLGTLFFAQGGPGGSGRIPPSFSSALRERFDIVGYDPRGIASSTQVRCFNSNAQALRLLGAPFPITLAQEQDVIRRAARATELCARNGGPLLSHMSTANVARDLDLLRQAVGEEQMNLFGISYGSFVGEVYANLFGERVRAMALDGILDPVEWTTGRTPAEAAAPYEYRVGSYLGANQALEAFLDACQAAPSCFFRDPQLDLREKYDRLLERVRRRPVNVSLPNGRQVRLTYQVLVEGSNDALLRQDNSLGLGFVLQQGWEATEGPATPPPPAEPVQEDRYLAPERGKAVACVDTANPSNPWDVPRYARRADRQGGPFGSYWVYKSLPCATWPATDEDRYTGPWDRPTANPILLIANRGGDPSTPYEDAVSTAGELADARLLTLDAFGHLAHGAFTDRLSACVDAAVDDYLIALRLPPEGTVCRPDRGPFGPSARAPAGPAAPASFMRPESPQDR